MQKFKLLFSSLITIVLSVLAIIISNPTAFAEEVTQLPEGTITCESISDSPVMIPYEEDGGIYILDDSILKFYNTTTENTSTIYNFDYVTDSYVVGNKIYILEQISYESVKISVYDLATKSIIKTIDLLESVETMGVDSQGRIYIAGYDADGGYIKLLSEDGTELSTLRVEDSVYDFAGFDSTNGNFYVVGYANWVYWGYDHAMNVLRVGNVKDNKLSLSENYIEIICQKFFYERKEQVALLENKYICIDNTFNTQLQLIDSNVQPLNSTEAKYIVKIDRKNADDEEFDETAAVGVRTIYLKERNSIVSFKDNASIAEYDLTTGKELASVATKYPVFALMEYKGGIVAIEKNAESFYYEYFEWKDATYIKVSGSTKSMKVGTTQKLKVTTDATLEQKYKWESNNSKIVSVNQSGEVCAWKTGTATITVSDNKGLKATYMISVTENTALKTPNSTIIKLKGKKTYNLSNNNYSTYGKVVGSYLFQDSEGLLNRVECSGEEIIVERYSSNGKKLVSTKKINMELTSFGGFYAGNENYYFVFGQSNPKENNNKEVVRIVKYSKDWQRMASASIKGANTVYPFSAGSLRMVEVGGKLYIHTCHEMYASDDGLNHQANMTFVINEKDMKLLDSYYDVMNIAQAGYVSHSFNQFIKADEKFVYRVDHGDAYPRAVALTKCDINGEITNVEYTLPIDLSEESGYWGNATGASVGGFELSEEECIIVGNAVDYSKKGATNSDIRNVFVSITDKELKDTKVIWLTKYNNSSSMQVRTPNITKINANHFIIMWEESDNATGQSFTRMLTMNNRGDFTSEIIKTDKSLSDCQPIMCKDGFVRWYVGDEKNVKLYTVNPYDLVSIVINTPAKVAALKQNKSYYTSSIKMSWKKVAGAQGYEIHRAASKKGKYKKVSATKGTSYKNSRLKPGKKYYYKVRAYKTVNGNKIYGKFSSAVAMDTKPLAPVITVKKAGKKIKVTWKKVTGATNYEVYMSYKKSGKYKKVKTIKSKVQTYSKTKPEKVKKCFFKVRAYKLVKNKRIYSNWSKVKS